MTDYSVRINNINTNDTDTNNINTTDINTTDINTTDINTTDINTTDINRNIYRYKFTDEFTKELYIFSKIHQYDHRTDFKEAWAIWIEEEDEIVNLEIRRLHNLGYDGDILDKMFKSARYYFRKKSTEKKEPVKRRDYIGIQKDILDSIDDHIKANINMEDYKPSTGFSLYCKDNFETLKEEVSRLYKLGFKNHIDIKNKIKKTYKNRYFILVSK